MTSNTSHNTINFKKILLNILFYVRKAPLIFNGILMLVFTLPMYNHFQNIRCAGFVYSYLSYNERIIWDRAISAKNLLHVFAWISVIFILSGIALIVLEKKKILQKTISTNDYFLWIPLSITAIIILYAYPKIINYGNTFSYLIYS